MLKLPLPQKMMSCLWHCERNICYTAVDAFGFDVRLRGLEPPRAVAHNDLNVACLPVPPQPHKGRVRWEKEKVKDID